MGIYDFVNNLGSNFFEIFQIKETLGFGYLKTIRILKPLVIVISKIERAYGLHEQTGNNCRFQQSLNHYFHHFENGGHIKTDFLPL